MGTQMLGWPWSKADCKLTHKTEVTTDLLSTTRATYSVTVENMATTNGSSRAQTPTFHKEMGVVTAEWFLGWTKSTVLI